MKSKYPNLISPITINGMTLRNRTVMPPIGSNFATVTGEVSEEMIKYYELRAKGGTGLIIVENMCIDFPMATNGTKQCRIDDNQFVPGLYTLVERLHAYGAKVSVQLNHAGASAFALRLNGAQPVSSSNIPSKTGGAVPRPLNADEMKAIAAKFGEAAARAQLAGFDTVEIHCGHSYLLNQFLSPLFNDRKDEFGGSAENRARFPKMVIEAVRAAVGPRFPIDIRVSADDMLAGGNTLEDTLDLLQYMADKVDFINVSVAQNDNLYLQHDKMSLPEGWRSYMAKAVKDKFNIPVITSGNFRSADVCEKTIVDGDADLIAMGRGLIAEPYWANKVATGEENLLRRCISCNIGCADHRLAKSQPIRCTINPDLLFEDAYMEKQVKKPVNVVVIGGGTAGLEAACTAAEVGCNVTLFEAKNRLGGLAWMIGTVPAKARIHYFVEYLENRAAALPNLTVKLNTKATTEAIDALNPDMIINATGSKPLLPPIAGLCDRVDKLGGKVKSTFGFIDNIDSFGDCKGKKVAVVGGGAVGLDVVEFFAERGSDVAVIEMLPVVGKDLDTNTKLDIYNTIKVHNVKVMTNTALQVVNDDSFTIKTPEGAVVEMNFDYGFVCLGMRSENSEFPTVDAYASEKGVKVFNIGDSGKVRRIINGVEEGRNLVKTLEVMGAFK
jgi:2,4-dienoyl-CoA reductase-like NADH-dependent reductase (Old Yellow Enzyme family)/thioredoxin reductase